MFSINRLLTAMVLASMCSTATAIRLYQLNLRYDSIADGIPLSETLASLSGGLVDPDTSKYYSDPSEVSWSRRRIKVAQEMFFAQPDIITIEEALRNQVDDLVTLLNYDMNNAWSWVGVARNTGIDQNSDGSNDTTSDDEYICILYNTETVDLSNWDKVWLSETPLEVSKYSDAGHYRVQTMGYFTEKSSNVKFGIIATHWDDSSDGARQLAASIARYTGAYMTDNWGPTFVMGDFNSPSSGAHSTGYNITVGIFDYISMNSTLTSKYQSSISSTFCFNDLLGVTPVRNRAGHHATFNGFYEIGYTDSFGRIDFIMGGNTSVSTGTINSLLHHVGENWYDLSYHLSDHRPVVAVVALSS
ncbi:Endonuclease/exonuclease/phosphatase [Dipodascopsis uninucleata]